MTNPIPSARSAPWLADDCRVLSPIGPDIACADPSSAALVAELLNQAWGDRDYSAPSECVIEAKKEADAADIAFTELTRDVLRPLWLAIANFERDHHDLAVDSSKVPFTSRDTKAELLEAANLYAALFAQIRRLALGTTNRALYQFECSNLDPSNLRNCLKETIEWLAAYSENKTEGGIPAIHEHLLIQSGTHY